MSVNTQSATRAARPFVVVASAATNITRTADASVAPEATTTNKRPRVLISAFAVSPIRGSEPAVGWHIPLRLAQWFDVTVLCAPEIENEPYRDEIDAYLRANGPVRGLQFEYVERPRLCRWLQRETFNGPLVRGLYYHGYAAWQRAAFQRARELHQRNPFDLVHQLEITGYREPGLLWKLDAPFVWGPITGAGSLPRSYLPLLSWKDRLFHVARAAVNHWEMRNKRRCRKAAQAAQRIWAVSADDLAMVRDIWKRPCLPLREVGTSPQPLARLCDYDGARPLRIVWSGMHISRKALPLLLHALQRLVRLNQWELTVLGSGPLSGEWKSLAEGLGIASRIRWTGRLPLNEAMATVAASDVFVLSSLHEATSTVTVEALSLGVPVICHDACGMSSAVTDECGIKIPRLGPQASIDGFAAALRLLLNHPQELARLSRGALRHAREMTWEATASEIAREYREVLREGCRRKDEG